jgi:ADP-heptose:LPS heptosyltransferase
MHLIETYAIVSGCQINKPFIHEEPLELPTKKYITFHTYNPKGAGRQYRSWDKVINLLRQNAKFDYELIQIGGISDHRQNINISYLGKTTYNSLAYLIKHSSMHVGFDSLPVHLASHYQKKIVSIYAHYANNSKPYFSKNKDITIIEPDFSKVKPTFAHEDPFDLINTIPPEKIYSSIINLI